jgi:hypothetical protein
MITATWYALPVLHLSLCADVPATVQYGGDDRKAIKSAAHEFRSVVTLMGASVAHLHVPLMALIKCRGFVVVVQSLLPVGRTTIVYGSNDAGLTIHASNAEFERLMKQVRRHSLS